MRRSSNSCTSLLFLLPFINSLQASRRLSSEMISWQEWIHLLTPRRVLPVINHALSIYKVWLVYKNDFPKGLQRTLGEKVDSTFLIILETLFIASYQSRLEKIPTLLIAVKKTDLLKFFLQVAWELRALNNKKYISLSVETQELGRMIGAWKKGVESKLPSVQLGRTYKFRERTPDCQRSTCCRRDPTY